MRIRVYQQNPFFFTCKSNFFSMGKNVENTRKKSLTISRPIHNSQCSRVCLLEENNRERELPTTCWVLSEVVSFNVVLRFAAPSGLQPKDCEEGLRGGGTGLALHY